MRCSPNRAALWLAASSLFPPGWGGATAQPALRSGVSLVLVNAQASDSQGHFVPGLCRDRFRLFEDGVEQPILSCTLESAAVSTAIVFDASGSMEPVLDMGRAAIREFIRTSDPEDEFSLTLVRDMPSPEVALSDEPDRLLARVDQTVSGGRTALRDAIYLAAHQLERARHPRRAMLIVSDGGENCSRYRSSEVRSFVRETDITVYVIGVHSGSPRTSAAGRYYLRCLAQESGGRYFDAYSAKDFPRIMEMLDIRNQYVLAYSPKVHAAFCASPC